MTVRIAAGTAALCCLGLVGPAVAQDTSTVPPGYILAFKETDGDTVFVHVDSIRREGASLEAWAIRNQAEPYGETLSSLILAQYDCTRRRSGLVLITHYSLRGGNGDIVLQSNTVADPSMTPHPPGTPLALLLEFVCDQG